MGTLLKRLRVVDIETTGQAPPAEVIEFGRVDVCHAGSEWQVGRPMARLYRCINGIPPETMAVHHITEADIAPDTPSARPNGCAEPYGVATRQTFSLHTTAALSSYSSLRV